MEGNKKVSFQFDVDHAKEKDGADSPIQLGQKRKRVESEEDDDGGKLSPPQLVEQEKERDTHADQAHQSLRVQVAKLKAELEIEKEKREKESDQKDVEIQSLSSQVEILKKKCREMVAFNDSMASEDVMTSCSSGSLENEFYLTIALESSQRELILLASQFEAASIRNGALAAECATWKRASLPASKSTNATSLSFEPPTMVIEKLRADVQQDLVKLIGGFESRFNQQCDKVNATLMKQQSSLQEDHTAAMDGGSSNVRSIVSDLLKPVVPLFEECAKIVEENVELRVVSQQFQAQQNLNASVSVEKEDFHSPRSSLLTEILHTKLKSIIEIEHLHSGQQLESLRQENHLLKSALKTAVHNNKNSADKASPQSAYAAFADLSTKTEEVRKLQKRVGELEKDLALVNGCEQSVVEGKQAASGRMSNLALEAAVMWQKRAAAMQSKLSQASQRETQLLRERIELQAVNMALDCQLGAQQQMLIEAAMEQVHFREYYKHSFVFDNLLQQELRSGMEGEAVIQALHQLEKVSRRLLGVVNNAQQTVLAMMGNGMQNIQEKYQVQIQSNREMLKTAKVEADFRQDVLLKAIQASDRLIGKHLLPKGKDMASVLTIHPIIAAPQRMDDHWTLKSVHFDVQKAVDSASEEVAKVAVRASRRNPSALMLQQYEDKAIKAANRITILQQASEKQINALEKRMNEEVQEVASLKKQLSEKEKELQQYRKETTSSHYQGEKSTLEEEAPNIEIPVQTPPAPLATKSDVLFEDQEAPEEQEEASSPDEEEGFEGSW